MVGGIQWLAAGGGWGEGGGWVIQSDVLNGFWCFFLYHPKNRPSLSEPSDSLPWSEWRGSLTTPRKGILQYLWLTMMNGTSCIGKHGTYAATDHTKVCLIIVAARFSWRRSTILSARKNNQLVSKPIWVWQFDEAGLHIQTKGMFKAFFGCDFPLLHLSVLIIAFISLCEANGSANCAVQCNLSHEIEPRRGSVPTGFAGSAQQKFAVRLWSEKQLPLNSHNVEMTCHVMAASWCLLLGWLTCGTLPRLRVVGSFTATSHICDTPIDDDTVLLTVPEVFAWRL